jgi:hypothetical protein
MAVSTRRENYVRTHSLAVRAAISCLLFLTGSHYVSGNGLSLTASSTFSGSDAIGEYTGTALNWTGPNDGAFVTRFYVYSNFPAITFEQFFPNGLTGTALTGSGNYDDQTSSFPSFVPDATPEESGLGYIAWQGCMCGAHVGQWSQQSSAGFGRESGVVAYFNASRAAIVLSAASNFMVA